MTFYERFLESLRNDYPLATSRIDLGQRFSPNLVCPHALRIPKQVLAEAKSIVAAFFELRMSAAWQGHVLEQTGLTHPNAADEPGNFSALMGYDFHLNKEGQLKLIEINTNASMSLISDALYRMAGVQDPWQGRFRNLVVETFRSEYQLSQAGEGSALRSIAIADEAPLEQRLYLEFLLYQELFENHGIDCRIEDSGELGFDPTSRRLRSSDGTQIDLVYNRDTDFYLETPRTSSLREAWLARAACVSPNPREYALLADKTRLIELSKHSKTGTTAEASTKAVTETKTEAQTAGAPLATRFGISEKSASLITSCLLHARDVDPADADRLWESRNRLFFKPKRSFGGKAVYRGSSVSRRVFNEHILKNDYVAQEFAPPTTVSLPSDDFGQGGGEFKFDLRFFAYRGEVQLGIARLYQGQTTNFQNAGGGVATLEFI